MSLKHDNYIKDRKNVTIFLGEEIKMKLSKIVSCISCVRGHQSRKQSAINKLLPRIEKCKRTGLLDLRNLNLNNSDVEEILKYVTKKNITVRTLDLRFNELTTLPESIGLLQGLEWLDLDNNHLTTLPESIGACTSLKWLGLAHNQLTTLPESIGLLQGLERLYLKKNYLPIGSIQLYYERVVLIENQKNQDNLIYDLRNIKKIIHDKVLYYTGNPLGQLTLEETFNHAVFNSLDQSKVPINIDNKYIYSLIGLLKLEEKYQDELPSIKRQIDHLQKIDSERNCKIPEIKNPNEDKRIDMAGQLL